MKCKNIECENEINGKNVYCSLKCRNIYVNKYLRNYDKVKEYYDKKRILLEEEYLKNPKYCLQCVKIIPFDKKENNYCNSSCMATYTNKFKKGIKHNISEQGRKSLIDIANKNFLNKRGCDERYKLEKITYYENPNKCINCNKILEYKYRNRICCNLSCKNEFYLKNLDDYKIYHPLTDFKFGLKKFEDEFDFTLIEKNGWYKAKNNGDNINGISRDHRFSVKEGFRRLINPLLLSHPANCELILNKHNQSKCDKCSIDINDLLLRIEIFDNKYGKYYKDELKTFINLDELKDLYKLYSYTIGV